MVSKKQKKTIPTAHRAVATESVGKQKQQRLTKV